MLQLLKFDPRVLLPVQLVMLIQTLLLVVDGGGVVVLLGAVKLVLLVKLGSYALSRSLKKLASKNLDPPTKGTPRKLITNLSCLASSSVSTDANLG